MKGFFRLVSCAFLLVFSRMMPAQNLPALQQDAAVTVGALQNGISYYLVTNPAMKGVADYALVRKGAADTLSTRLPAAFQQDGAASVPGPEGNRMPAGGIFHHR